MRSAPSQSSPLSRFDPGLIVTICALLISVDSGSGNRIAQPAKDASGGAIPSASLIKDNTIKHSMDQQSRASPMQSPNHSSILFYPIGISLRCRPNRLNSRRRERQSRDSRATCRRAERFVGPIWRCGPRCGAARRSPAWGEGGAANNARPNPVDSRTRRSPRRIESRQAGGLVWRRLGQSSWPQRP